MDPFIFTPILAQLGASVAFLLPLVAASDVARALGLALGVGPFLVLDHLRGSNSFGGGRLVQKILQIDRPALRAPRWTGA